MSQLMFGIDKLALSIPEFNVDSIKPFNVTPNSKKAGESTIRETYLFRTDKEGDIYGKNVYLNEYDFNLTITPYGQRVNAVVVYNPSKLFGSLTLDPNIINEKTLTIVEKLKALGISINIDTAFISRLDLGADNMLENPFREYRQIIQGKTEQKNTKSTDYLDTKTFGTGNGTMQFSCYDKGKEREKEQYGKPLSSSTNYARLESRLLRGKAIKRIIGEADTYNKLLETESKSFNKAYLHVINNFINIRQTDCDFPDITSLIDIVKINRKRFPKQWLLISLNAFLMSFNNKDIDTLRVLMTEAIREAIRQESTVSKKNAERTINYAIQGLNDTITQIQFQSNRLNQNSITARIDKRQELIDKFIAPFQNAM